MKVSSTVLAVLTCARMAGAQDMFTDAPCLTVTVTQQLTGDLFCDCGVSPAIEIVGPARLDLGGFTVKCDSGAPFEIIRLTGEGAFLRNGVVSGVDATNVGACVYLAGVGNHKVSGVTVMNCTSDCIDTSEGSDGNRITDNVIDGCDNEGIEADGENTLVRRNVIRNVNEICVKSDGASNTVRENTIVGCGQHGIEVDGIDTVVRGNNVTNAGRNGIWVNDGEEATVRLNRVIGSGEVGILVERWDHRVNSNVVMGSGLEGIKLAANVRFTLARLNTATGNTNEDLFDGSDLCEDNTWSENTFGTANQACIV